VESGTAILKQLAELDGRLRAQDDQLRSHDKHMRSQDEHIRGQDERVRSQDERLRGQELGSPDVLKRLAEVEERLRTLTEAATKRRAEEEEWETRVSQRLVGIEDREARSTQRITDIEESVSSYKRYREQVQDLQTRVSELERTFAARSGETSKQVDGIQRWMEKQAQHP